MKIIKLSAENIKRLRAVEITPTGEIVTIAGKNAQGKSSILDAIWWCLAGASHVQAQPIRQGQTKARIKLDLGELIVERRFTEAGSSLFVENADGARYSSPQKMLDALLGELSFDPLAFARMDPRKQFDELRRIAKVELDIDKLDGLNRNDYEKRTAVNRDARVRRAQADAITVADGLPEKPVDESALIDAMQIAGENNAEIEIRKGRRAQASKEIEAGKTSAQSLAQRAAALRLQADQLDAEAVLALGAATGLQKQLDDAPALPAPTDVTALRAQLDQAKRTNVQIAAREQRKVIVSEGLVLEKQSSDLSDAMAAREKVKADAIAAAAMPVDGLGFGDGLVTYRGVPFEQASSAEQLRVSLSIAMAANPKLRVIRIQDGSLLDDDSLAAIAAMAKDGDYQVWIEKVDASGKVGFVIEDGAVVAVDGVPTEATEGAVA